MKEISKEVEFTPPKGFKPPESSEQGKDWDMVCSFRTKPDGTICMTKLGDTPMPGYDDDDDDDHDEAKEHKPDYSEYSGKIMNAMSESGMGGGGGGGGTY